MYDEDTSFGKMLRSRADGLGGMAAPAPDYKPVDEDGMRDLLKTAFAEDAGPNSGTNALVELRRAKNYIEPFIFGKDIEESEDVKGDVVLPDYLPTATSSCSRLHSYQHDGSYVRNSRHRCRNRK